MPKNLDIARVDDRIAPFRTFLCLLDDSSLPLGEIRQSVDKMWE